MSKASSTSPNTVVLDGLVVDMGLLAVVDALAVVVGATVVVGCRVVVGAEVASSKTLPHATPKRRPPLPLLVQFALHSL